MTPLLTLSQTKAKGIDRTPWLVECLNTYFAPGQFIFDRSHLIDIKWRGDGYYCVMLFQVGDDFIMADVAGYTKNGEDFFEVCNDSETCEDLNQWKKVKIDKFCDGYTISE